MPSVAIMPQFETSRRVNQEHCFLKIDQSPHRCCGGACAGAAVPRKHLESRRGWKRTRTLLNNQYQYPSDDWTRCSMRSCERKYHQEQLQHVLTPTREFQSLFDYILRYCEYLAHHERGNSLRYHCARLIVRFTNRDLLFSCRCRVNLPDSPAAYQVDVEFA